MPDNLLEKFAPLIGVISFVIVSTIAASVLTNSSEPMQIGKLFMGMFFLTFGAFKAYNLEGFKEAFKMYDLLAERFDSYATAYPFIELSLGFLYLSLLFFNNIQVQVFTHLAAIFVMGIGGLGVLHALREGRDLKCACLGNVFNVPMTTVTLIEDLGMSGMAVWMLFAIL